jgi:hypothetical protein
VVNSLVEHGVLARTELPGEAAVLPARSLENITVKHVLDALKGTAGSVEVPSDSWLDRHLDGLLLKLNEESARSPSNCTLLELAHRAEAGEGDVDDATTPDVQARAELGPV